MSFLNQRLDLRDYKPSWYGFFLLKYLLQIITYALMLIIQKF